MTRQLAERKYYTTHNSAPYGHTFQWSLNMVPHIYIVLSNYSVLYGAPEWSYHFLSHLCTRFTKSVQFWQCAKESCAQHTQN